MLLFDAGGVGSAEALTSRSKANRWGFPLLFLSLRVLGWSIGGGSAPRLTGQGPALLPGRVTGGDRCCVQRVRGGSGGAGHSELVAETESYDFVGGVNVTVETAAFITAF